MAKKKKTPKKRKDTSVPRDRPKTKKR